MDADIRSTGHSQMLWWGIKIGAPVYYHSQSENWIRGTVVDVKPRGADRWISSTYIYVDCAFPKTEKGLSGASFPLAPDFSNNRAIFPFYQFIL